MGSLLETITRDVDTIVSSNMEVEDLDAVPQRDALRLGGTAAQFTTAALYMDARDSSQYPVVHRRRTVAKMFNALLNSAVRIVRAHKGHVRSFNGDSILAFMDPALASPADSAVKCGFQLLYIVREVLRPKFKAAGYADNFSVGVGVAYGNILAARVGLRNDPNNDLIFPATATNLAAKLGDRGSEPHCLLIASEVFQRLDFENRYTEAKFLFWKRKVAIWREDLDFKFAGKRLVVYKTDHQEAP